MRLFDQTKLNEGTHAGTTAASGQESNGLPPPACHYDSDGNRDTGIHPSTRRAAKWIPGSLASLAPRNDERNSITSSNLFKENLNARRYSSCPRRHQEASGL